MLVSSPSNNSLKERTTGILILLVVGGLTGRVASMIMGLDAQQGVPLNVVVGIVGAPITSGAISFPSVLVSLLGAIVLLAIVNLLRRGSVR